MKPTIAPADAPPSRSHALVFGVGALGLVAAVGLIYSDAARAYFFNDDFQWLQGAWAFRVENLLHIERYSHFYRPVVEIYFYLGRQLFGCAALPFHLASIAVHLVNTLLLYLFARLLTGKRAFAGLTALLFAVQPGYAEAVAWVAAISDLLLAASYLLVLWMHLLFLKGRGAWFYAISLAAFAICLLTHESSATLLPMMIALEVMVVWERGERARASQRGVRRAAAAVGAPVTARSLAVSAMRYAPFALLLAGYLALEYVVNSRSYLVREGHYQFGWHAVPHALQYLITLYVGRRDLVSHLLTVAVIAALLVRGTPRVRFFVLWMLVTIAPASFFTWGNVSRYLYLPAAGFAMLLAEAILKVRTLAAERVSHRVARAAAIALTAALAVRFAVFAAKVPAGFREWTRPYERYVAAIRKANPAPSPGSVVYVDRADARGVPATYRDPAGAVASCGADVHVVVR